jgi:exodeoxyribonuclease-1
MERLQIKDLVFNKSPMFVPNIYKLDAKIVEQLQINMDTCLQRLEFIKNNQEKITKVVQDLYRNDQERPPTPDVDQSLYDGFMDNADRRISWSQLFIQAFFSKKMLLRILLIVAIVFLY